MFSLENYKYQGSLEGIFGHKRYCSILISKFKNLTSSIIYGVINLNGNIISCSMDKTIKIWDIDNNQVKHTLIGHERGVTCIVYDILNDELISGSEDCTLKFWKDNQC